MVSHWAKYHITQWGPLSPIDSIDFQRDEASAGRSCSDMNLMSPVDASCGKTLTMLNRSFKFFRTIFTLCLTSFNKVLVQVELWSVAEEYLCRIKEAAVLAWVIHAYKVANIKVIIVSSLVNWLNWSSSHFNWWQLVVVTSCGTKAL